ncbi:MAG: DeoR family transcriptional regulator [Gammaproteobacteria bacterium]
MDRTERFYKIDQLLNRHKSVPIDVLLGELEVSPATFKRDLDYLRDIALRPAFTIRASLHKGATP